VRAAAAASAATDSFCSAPACALIVALFSFSLSTFPAFSAIAAACSATFAFGPRF